MKHYFNIALILLTFQQERAFSMEEIDKTHKIQTKSLESTQISKEKINKMTYIGNSFNTKLKKQGKQLEASIETIQDIKEDTDKSRKIIKKIEIKQSGCCTIL